MSFVPLFASSNQNEAFVSAAISLKDNDAGDAGAGVASSSAPKSKSLVPVGDWCTSTASTFVPATRLVAATWNKALQALLVTSTEAGVENVIAPPGMFTRRISTPFR